MRSGRLVALVIGCLLLLPGIALLLGGGGVGGAYVLGRDGNSHVSESSGPLESSTAAITTGGLDLVADPETPDWLPDRLATDLRLEVSPATAGTRLVAVTR